MSNVPSFKIKPACNAGLCHAELVSASPYTIECFKTSQQPNLSFPGFVAGPS
jgi:hypothetical protein